MEDNDPSWEDTRPLVGKCSAAVPGYSLGTCSHTSAGPPLRRPLYSRQVDQGTACDLSKTAVRRQGCWPDLTGAPKPHRCSQVPPHHYSSCFSFGGHTLFGPSSASLTPCLPQSPHPIRPHVSVHNLGYPLHFPSVMRSSFSTLFGRRTSTVGDNSVLCSCVLQNPPRACAVQSPPRHYTASKQPTPQGSYSRFSL